MAVARELGTLATEESQSAPRRAAVELVLRDAITYAPHERLQQARAVLLSAVPLLLANFVSQSDEGRLLTSLYQAGIDPFAPFDAIERTPEPDSH